MRIGFDLEREAVSFIGWPLLPIATINAMAAAIGPSCRGIRS
jgi:hypothetical protein